MPRDHREANTTKRSSMTAKLPPQGKFDASRSMTEPPKVPTIGSRGQLLKIPQYLAAGERLKEMIAAYRAARGADETPAPAPIKRKPYRLLSLETPTPIEGFPLNPPGEDVPDYGSMSRVKATRATQAARRGKRAPLTPSGPAKLIKRRGRGNL
jgi:hypothetical protein